MDLCYSFNILWNYYACCHGLEFFDPRNVKSCLESKIMWYWGMASKGSTSVIPNWPSMKIWLNARFTMVPCKALSDQVWNRYQWISIFILFIFNCGISVKVHFCSSYLEKFTEIHSFWVRKTMLSSTFLIKLRLPGYRCKSGIAIFACKVTGNYAYSPFKARYFITFKIQVNLPEWDQTGKNKSEVYPLV